eukprot:scaffold274398_cov36-Tisochrysis_lutea.AAC.3
MESSAGAGEREARGVVEVDARQLVDHVATHLIEARCSKTVCLLRVLVVAPARTPVRHAVGRYGAPAPHHTPPARVLCPCSSRTPLPFLEVKGR